MSYKIVNIQKKTTITPSMEDAILKAFEEFDADSSLIGVSSREHLTTEFQEGICCSHQWKQAPLDEEVTVWFQKNFEEETSPGKYCTRCGAASLWENGHLWAYDGTARFFGKVRRDKGQRRS